MKRLLLFMTIAAALGGCAHLPEIQPGPTPAAGQGDFDGRRIFPQGRWQLYHAIEATVPGGRQGLLTGVTVLSSRERSIECALMTVEGFVLFKGRFDGRLTVDRAVAPFDRPGFAQGLMEDLAALFFAPPGLPCQTGRIDRQERIYRYCQPGRTTDILLKPDQSWEVHQYDSRNRLARSIEARAMTRIDGQSFAEKLTLRHRGLLGYRLGLKLIEAVPLD
jgi:hypothetical protein